MPIKKKIEETKELSIEEAIQKASIEKPLENENPIIIQGEKVTFDDLVSMIYDIQHSIGYLHFHENEPQTVIITKIHQIAKVEENKLGLDLFLLSDIELDNSLTTLAKTGIIVDIPDGYFGMITLDNEIASNGATMVGSPKYIYGKQEIEFYLTAMIGNYFEFRKGRKIAQIVFYKKENIKYEYAS